ncbi:MAG: rod shape-determining protein MreD [candidate division WOR-3 bacterium]
MRYFFVIILSLFFLYFVSTVPPFLSIKYIIQPDLIIILVIFVCLNFDEIFTYIFSFIIGFFCDALTGTSLGFHSSIFLFISYITARFGNFFYKERFLNRMLLVLISDLLYRFILVIINFNESKSILTIFIFIFIIPVYTVFIYTIFHILNRFLKRIYVQR